MWLPTTTLPATTVATASAAAAVAASTTAISATATTVSTAAAATISAAAAATAPRRTRFTRAGLVDSQRPTFNSLAIKFLDRFLRIGLGGHGHKSEATRFTGEFILHQRDLLHWARLREKILQICLGRVEGKISYV